MITQKYLLEVSPMGPENFICYVNIETHGRTAVREITQRSPYLKDAIAPIQMAIGAIGEPNTGESWVMFVNQERSAHGNWKNNQLTFEDDESIKYTVRFCVSANELVALKLVFDIEMQEKT